MDTTKEIIRRQSHTQMAGLHIREAEGEESGRTIEGYAILFDTPSAPLYDDGDEELREIIDPEAVTQELLDSSDIKMTLFHNRQLLLARSKQGKGTLSYTRDEKGVKFSFTAPATADGDKAVELVRSGIIDGCSFAFSTRYWDSAFVERTVKKEGDKRVITARVKIITGLYDMTLTPDPAYPDTDCSLRERIHAEAEEGMKKKKDLRAYIGEMRSKGKGIG